MEVLPYHPQVYSLDTVMESRQHSRPETGGYPTIEKKKSHISTAIDIDTPLFIWTPIDITTIKM